MRLYKSYTGFLSKYGKFIMIFTVLMMAFSLAGIILVDINTDFTVFMPMKSEQLKKIHFLNDIFGDSDEILILISSDNSREDLDDISFIADELSLISGINKVELPYSREILDSADFDTDTLLENLNTGIELKNSDWVICRVFLGLHNEYPPIIKNIQNTLDGSGREYLLSGEPYLQGKIFDYILRVLIFLPPIAIILLVNVFRIRIGSLRATVLSMSPAIIAGVMTLGIMSWIEGSISIMTVLIPIFIIVLGSADGLHITSHVMDRLAEGRSTFAAVSETLEAVGVPIIMTSLTTMAGFLSMLLIDSEAIRSMAAGAAWGILAAGAATWIILPILLLHQKPLESRRYNSKNRVLGLFKKIQGGNSIVITLLIIAVAIPGTFFLKSDFSMLSMYKKNTEVYQSIDRITEILGGAIPVTLLYEAPSPLDMNTAEAVLAFQKEVNKKGIAGSSLSLFSLVEGFLSSTTRMTEIPDDPFVQRMILNRIKKLSPSGLDNFYSDEGYGRAFFFLPDLSDATLNGFIETAEQISKDYGIELQPVSTAFAMKELNDTIMPQQTGSLVLAVILVMVLTTITQRSFKLGILSGIPVAITLAGLFGFMGYSGIRLSIISSMMAGLTVGVGIDYAIHFVSLYRFEKKKLVQGEASTLAVTRALDYVATPVIANAMGLAIGFTAMVFSPFQIHVTLSILMWVTMILSSFLSLSLLPTILKISLGKNGDKINEKINK